MHGKYMIVKYRVLLRQQGRARETDLGPILTSHSQKQTVLEYILSRLCLFFFAKLRRCKETYFT